MNDAGGTNETYPWVEAAVRLMRPTVAVIVLGVWASAHFGGPESMVSGFTPINTETIDNFAAAIGFYLFGDRTLFYSRKALQK